MKSGGILATELQTAFNGIVGFANGGTSAVSALLSSDPTATTHSISNILQNFGNLESAIGAFKAIPGLGATILGVVGNLEAAVGAVIAGLNDMQQFTNDAASILGIIKQSQDTYNKAVLATSATAGRLEQAFTQLQIEQKFARRHRRQTRPRRHRARTTPSPTTSASTPMALWGRAGSASPAGCQAVRPSRI